jgi:hypothetical protein
VVGSSRYSTVTLITNNEVYLSLCVQTGCLRGPLLASTAIRFVSGVYSSTCLHRDGNPMSFKTVQACVTQLVFLRPIALAT